MIPDEQGMATFSKTAAIAIAILLLPACAGDNLTALLTLPPDIATTELLHIAFDGAPERDRLVVIDPSSAVGALPVDFAADDRVTFDAFLYNDRMCELWVMPSVIERAPGTGRCLPQTDRHYAARMVDGVITKDWSRVVDDTDLADEFAFVSTSSCGGDLLGCLASGACITESGGACTTCPPAPEILAADEPNPPEPPTLPSFVDGPPGWTTKRFYDDKIEARIPWAEDEPPCSEGLVRFPGDAACAPLADCPAGRFDAELECQPDVIHVAPGAMQPSDGTCDRPFATIAEGIAAAPSGATIALAKGVHVIDDQVAPRTVSIVGACPTETTVHAFGGVGGSLRGLSSLHVSRLHYQAESEGIAVRGRARLSVDHVSMSGGLNAIAARFGGGATLDSVWIESSSIAIRIESASLDAARLGIVRAHAPVQFKAVTGTIADFLFEDVQVDDDDASRGYAFWAVDDSEVHLHRGWIRGGTGTGIRISSGTFDGQDLVVTDLRPSLVPGGTSGIAFDFNIDSVTTLRRAVIERVHRGGIYGGGAGPAVVDLQDVVVRTVAPSKEEDADNIGLYEGRGVVMLNSGALTVNRIYVEDTQREGIATIGPATVMNATIVNVRPDKNGAAGSGVYFNGSTYARWVHIRSAATVGVQIPETAPNLTVEIEDLVVEDTGRAGKGRAFYSGGNGTTLTRARLQHQACGLLVRAGSGPIFVTDVEVLDMWGNPGPDSELCGVQVGRTTGDGPPIVADRLRVIGTKGVHLFGSESTMTNLIVRGNEPSMLSIANGGALHAERVLLDGSASAVIDVETNSTMSLRDAVVVRREQTPGTQAREEAVLVQRGAFFDAERFDLGAGRRIGLQACGGATVRLVDAVIRGERTAASIPRGLNIEAISERVKYEAEQFGVCDADRDPCAAQ